MEKNLGDTPSATLNCLFFKVNFYKCSAGFKVCIINTLIQKIFMSEQKMNFKLNLKIFPYRRIIILLTFTESHLNLKLLVYPVLVCV